MYFVVLWHEWSATIPASWLNLEIKSFKWPLEKRNAAVFSIKGVAPTEEWENIEYKKFFGPFSTYEDGIKFEIKSSNVSTNDDEKFNEIEKSSTSEPTLKRRIIKPLRYNSTSTDNEDTTIPSKKFKRNVDQESNTIQKFHENSVGVNEIVKEPPINYIRKGTSYSNENFRDSQNTEDYLIDDDISSGQDKPVVISNVKTNIQLPMMEYKNIKLYENQSDLDQSCPQSCCAQMDLSKKLDAIYALQLENNKYMDCLLRSVKTVNLMLVDMNRNKPDNATHSTTNLKSSLCLPVASHSELMGFETNLKEDTRTRSEYRSLIKKVGGGNFEKVTRNALLATLNPEMAYKCSWSGANNSIKVEGTEFINLLIDTVVNNNENSTDDAVKKIIKTWLQKAGDRLPKKSKI